MGESSFSYSTEVAAPIDVVWTHITSPQGINREIMPFMLMTIPGSLKGVSIDDVEPGTVLGRSWLLLFGFIPIEYDDIGLAELEHGRRFLERSSMASIRFWEHERVLDVVGPKRTLVTDNIRYIVRYPVPGFTGLVGAAVRFLFSHRHRKLVKMFM